MNIYEIIIAELPELENSEEFRNGNSRKTQKDFRNSKK